MRSGQRSLAFSLTYRLPNRPLTDEDVEPAHNRIRWVAGAALTGV